MHTRRSLRPGRRCGSHDYRDQGMATVEFCTGSACTAAIACVLYLLVDDGTVVDLFTRLFHADSGLGWMTAGGAVWR